MSEKSPFTSEQLEEIEKLMKNIEELVSANLTDIDKGKPPTVPVTKKNMNDREEFTEIFLELINEIIVVSELKDNLEKYIFEPITYICRGLGMADDYSKYTPINRLYFLFLANLYCKSKIYFERYVWLPKFLFIFEQLGVTGLFAIAKNEYNTLFKDCPNKINYRLDEINNKPIVSNTTLNQIVEKTMCKYYDKGCTQKSHQHRSSYLHPDPLHSVRKSQSMKSVHKPHGGKKTRKRSKHKRNKHSKHKKSNKRNKHSKTNKRK
jgi:hypothetical protein